MLTEEDDVEIHALARRGWSKSAIARHTGRDRKTIRKYLDGPATAREPVPSALEPFRTYLTARFEDDPHALGTVLHRELVGLGFDRSYPTLVRELRRLELRPACQCCRAGGLDVTVRLEHEPGEELQLDWLELSETPWGEKAHVLVGALSHSGQIRGVLADGETFAHLIEALDGVLRRLGGTARSWRTDRMASVVYPGSDRLRPEAAAAAKHYGVTVAVCPANRPQRKGVVEAAIRYVTQSWWRSAPVSTPAQAQADLDRWSVAVSDRRRRGESTVGELAATEPLLALPELPFPAEHHAERVVSRDALVAFEGNRYSVPPGHAGASVTVRARLGELHLEIYSAAGRRIARHRRALAGAGQILRTEDHSRLLEAAVLDAFTTTKACPRKPNRPPGERAVAEAMRLRGEQPGAVVIDLDEYARIAKVAHG
jgi:transposase